MPEPGDLGRDASESPPTPGPCLTSLLLRFHGAVPPKPPPSRGSQVNDRKPGVSDL